MVVIRWSWERRSVYGDRAGDADIDQIVDEYSTSRKSFKSYAVMFGQSEQRARHSTKYIIETCIVG